MPEILQRRNGGCVTVERPYLSCSARKAIGLLIAQSLPRPQNTRQT